MNEELRLDARSIRKAFNRRTIFQNVSFALKQHETLLVTGRNGSGKSTLVKIISNVLTPTEGTVTVQRGSEVITEGRSRLIGLVSPYLQLYDEFSAEENLRFTMAIRGLTVRNSEIDGLLDMLGILHRKHDPVRTYSSGMKQRVKYAFALLHKPPVLILDEPTSNLDAAGIEVVRTIMRNQRERGLLVVATNDLSDIEHYDHRVDLDVTA